jgi:hypothetical protein
MFGFPFALFKRYMTHETPDFALIKIPGVKNNITHSPRDLIVEESTRQAVLADTDPHGTCKISVSIVTTKPTV